MKKIEFKALIRNIFSVRNDGTDKLVTIFGIPVKIDRSKYNKKIVENTVVEENKIIFNNFQGNLYGCNPKYIAEEIIKQKLPYKLCWLCRNIRSIDKKMFPKGINLVTFNGKKAIKALSSSKIIISNVRMNSFFLRGWYKKTKQIYLNTWHGSLGIKKIDASVKKISYADQKWCETSKDCDSKSIDYLLSNSDFEDDVFKNGMWYDGEILQTGHPRNDIFFKSEQEIESIKNKVFENLKIEGNKKVVLYVPSYRDDKRLDCYDLNTENLIRALNKKFDGEWIILVRMHPNIKRYSKKLFKFGKAVKDATNYPDIQELLASSDITITDYSSCIFDFMLSRKPAFIFATDIEQFNNERGFYYPLETTPFPIAKTNDELAKNIVDFDYEKYKTDVEKFLKDKGCMEDGHASERIVKLIEQIMKN